MDKFRGTASALELCEVVSEVLKLDCVPDCQPMSDGGEGFREAFTGETFAALVPGPLGERRASITLVTGAAGPVAIIECADAVGRNIYLIPPAKRLSPPRVRASAN